jgi:hypothetical protein
MTEQGGNKFAFDDVSMGPISGALFVGETTPAFVRPCGLEVDHFILEGHQHDCASSDTERHQSLVVE